MVIERQLLYRKHADRRDRVVLRVTRSGRRWSRFFGLGVEYERTSMGTTYDEPGSNEDCDVTVTLGPFQVQFAYYWKDLTRNRVDDPESAIYAQLQRHNQRRPCCLASRMPPHDHSLDCTARRSRKSHEE